METIEITTKVIEAAEGKTLRRIKDGFIAGSKVYLGYTYYLNGKRTQYPVMEVPEDYEEIDITDETVNE